MKLSLNELKKTEIWQKAGIEIPHFDIEKMRVMTDLSCKWLHFGAGNIFRGFPAARMQDLLEKGLVDTGIVVGEGFDYQIIDDIYNRYDNLCLMATLKSNATVDMRVIASVARAYRCSPDFKADYDALKHCFVNPALQMVSFTITEKGYAVVPEYVQEDIKRGPENCKTIMCMVTSFAFERFKAGAYPFAFVSMDNCSHNGEKLQNAVTSIAKSWLEAGFVGKDFIEYLSNPSKVAFPWSMIDKITPRPHDSVREMLKTRGFEDTDIVVTDKKTFIAPFVNAEECEYLVIEDTFPNGRPPLEKAGIYMTDRETVNKVERMKVCTCLNPLHTAMCLMGCLLDYTKISEEMKDEDIVAYIRRIGYVEGMPVVTDPGILSPKKFIDDVVERRLVNPFMPDTPQRIATDTSQKLPIRFGETVKAYIANSELDIGNLKCIPLVYASWMRYLLGVDDNGKEFELSPDPLLECSRAYLNGLKLGDLGPYDKYIKPLMEDGSIFGFNLWTSELKDKVVTAFAKMMKGIGAVRKTLHEYVAE